MGLLRNFRLLHRRKPPGVDSRDTISVTVSNSILGKLRLAPGYRALYTRNADEVLLSSENVKLFSLRRKQSVIFAIELQE